MGFLKRLLGDQAARERGDPTDLGDLRRALPPDAISLRSGPGREVVGESSYRSAIERLTGGPHRDGVRAITWATLVREPANPYDTNAVAVRIDGSTVGYLPRIDATSFAPFLDRLAAAGRVAFCRADIRGGWDRGRSDKGDYAITLYVGGADRQAELIAQELDGRSRAYIASSKPAMQPGTGRGPGFYRGRHFSEWFPEVQRLRAMKADEDAERLLLMLVDATEQEATAEGFGVAPAAYEQLAVIYRGRKDRSAEISILERFAAQPHAPGALPPKLLERLAKLTGA